YFESKWTLPKDKKLLFVGTVIQRKGIEVLLEALGIVKKQIPEVALNVAGMVEEAYKNELIDKCRRLGLEGVIRFLGHQSAEQIADLHLESRLMAFPSFIDNSPNSVAEAMVSGLPIVASRVGGIPSMIEHDKTGLLVEPADSEALAESIIELLENDAKCLALSQSAQQIAFERYHPQKVATAAINAYKFILEQKIVLRESA
ncbi:MAG: glycosyltransferase family 4 protein, partial [Calditrichota bacterium]